MSNLLAIDVGNSNITLALHNGDCWTAQYRITTDPKREADEYVGILSPLLQNCGVSLSDIRTVVLGSVVAPVTHHLSVFIARFLAAELIIADLKDLPGGVLEIDTESPEKIGADRWLNLLAAKRFYFQAPTPLVVVDCGTAMTFDVLSQDGVFIGGVIAPGMEILRTALSDRIPALPPVKTSARPEIVIGVNTQEAMRAGLAGAFWGTIRTVLHDIERSLGRKPLVIATGGTITGMETDNDLFQIKESFLTLEGLRIFAHLVRERNVI